MVSPTSTLPCSTGAMAQISVLFLKPWLQTSFTHAWFEGICQRLEWSLYTEFKVSAFSDSPLFGFPFTLGSPGYAGLLLLFFIYQQDDLSVEFLMRLCCCHDDYTALGQSCKQKQTHESQKTSSKLVTPPYSLPVLVQSPKTVKRWVFLFFFLSRVYNYSLLEDPLIKGPPSVL